MATPIGNLEDVTLRALRILREADLVAAEDTRRTATLLQHYGIATPALSLHEHNERRRIPDLLERLKAGARVALVSDAGTPTISDPGSRLIQAAVNQGIRVEAIPGASAITTLLSISGEPVQRFTFVGFPPSRSGERQKWFGSLAVDVPGPVLMFEAPHRIRQTIQDIARHLGNRHVVLGRELTKLHEQVTRGWAVDLLDGRELPERGEYSILVSDRVEPGGRVREVPTDTELAVEFGQMSERSRESRRKTLAALAQKYRMSTREAYAAVERGLKSGT